MTKIFVVPLAQVAPWLCDHTLLSFFISYKSTTNNLPYIKLTILLFSKQHLLETVRHYTAMSHFSSWRNRFFLKVYPFATTSGLTLTSMRRNGRSVGITLIYHHSVLELSCWTCHWMQGDLKDLKDKEAWLHYRNNDMREPGSL
jgi:hypothetical protein